MKWRGWQVASRARRLFHWARIEDEMYRQADLDRPALFHENSSDLERSVRSTYYCFWLSARFQQVRVYDQGVAQR